MLVSPQISSPDLAVVMAICNEESNVDSVVCDWLFLLKNVEPNFFTRVADLVDGSTK